MVAPKKRKDGMPNKHVPKKEKKRVTMSQNKSDRDDSREKTIASRSKPHPSIHTLALFDRDCMTCFSMDTLFDFTIYRIQVCPFLSYLELHKGL